MDADPHAAALAARAAAAAAKHAGNAAAVSMAMRALGLAKRAEGDLPAALKSLRAAVRTAQTAGESELAAEARMSLAFVLLDRGRVVAALRAAEVATDALTGLPAARLRAQRALLRQRTGQLEQALEDFRQALPALRDAGDLVWEARLRVNRGTLLADRGDLNDAADDFNRALTLNARLNLDLLGANAAWGLGFVSARRGDVRAALAYYDATAAHYAALGVPVPELLVDRAEVLLSAGLVDEARACADEAADGLRLLLRETYLPEALLLQAQCALAGHDAAGAKNLAEQARRRFDSQRRTGWALVARFVALRAASIAGEPIDVAAAVRTADALQAAGWRVLALDGRLIAAEAAISSAQPGRARLQLQRATAARRGVVELRVRAWYAEALLRQVTGTRRSVDSALRAGLRAVDEHRASLGATELRVRASSHADALARLGLQSALRDRNPERVLLWSERYRAGTARLRPVTPPSDGQLAAILGRLRQNSAALESALGSGEPTAGLRARQATLEREVRVASRRVETPGGGAGGTVSPGALRHLLADRALVAHLVVDDNLHAVTVTSRRVALHALGPRQQAGRLLDAVHFALRRLAANRGSVPAMQAALAAAVAASTDLDALLLDPLRTEVGDRPVVMVPTAALHAVPWALLPSLRGRPVTVAPSATVWHRASALAATGTRGRGLLVAGPRLPAACDEVAELASTHPEAVCRMGPAATVSDVLAALGESRWAHIAAHGRLRTDNALFSSVELADGPLTVYDLEQLPRVPGLVVLPVCQSGVGVAHAGEEVLSLAGALLSLGTRTLVATVVPVPDRASRDLMLDLHARLALTDDVAVALAAAQSALPRHEPAAVAAAGGFVCLGA